MCLSGSPDLFRKGMSILSVFTTSEQLSLDLTFPRSFNSLCREYGHSEVSVRVNRRLRKGWYVTIHRLSGRRELCVPPVFENAPEPVKRALLEWATLPNHRNAGLRSQTRKKKRELEQLLRAHIEASRPVPRRPAVSSRAWPTRGTRYDLSEVFETINRDYFGSRLSAFLRWGANGSTTSYERSWREGPDGGDLHLITIAGVYNHPEVPRFAIEAIMFHEMLHIDIPPRDGNARRVVHGRDFRIREKGFPHYRKWVEWERGSLPVLCRQMRRSPGRKLPGRGSGNCSNWGKDREPCPSIF